MRTQVSDDLRPAMGIFHALLLGAAVWLATDLLWWAL